MRPEIIVYRDGVEVMRGPADEMYAQSRCGDTLCPAPAPVDRARRYTAPEIARATGLHVETIRRSMRAGELGSVDSPSGHFHGATNEQIGEWLRNRRPRNTDGRRARALRFPL